MAKLIRWSMLERDKGIGIQNDSQSHFSQDFSSKLSKMWKKEAPRLLRYSANLVLSCHCLCALFHEPFGECEVISYSFYNLYDGLNFKFATQGKG